MFEQNVLVLGLSTYNFKNDSDELVSGTTVYFTSLANDGSKENLVGLKPGKGTLPESHFSMHSSEKFPAYCKMQFSMDFSTQKIKPSGFSYVKALEVGDLSASKSN